VPSRPHDVGTPRRRLRRLAAAVAIGCAWVALGIAAVVYVGGFIMAGLVRGVVLLPRAIVWWLDAVEQGADFWSIAGQVGAALARALATTEATLWIVGFAVVGVGALYGLQWLLRDEEMRK
jgi:hypothetical protein